MSADDWAEGYARQADADFKTWNILQVNTDVPECHKLLFLQMACEKLCKAHLIAAGALPDTFQTSHGYIAGPLPTIIKSEIALKNYGANRQKSIRNILIAARHLAQEIEVLNPSVKRNGQRPDNCEYPWEDHGGTLHSPLDWTFPPASLLLRPHGPTILKLIQIAIERLLS